MYAYCICCWFVIVDRVREANIIRNQKPDSWKPYQSLSNLPPSSIHLPTCLSLYHSTMISKFRFITIPNKIVYIVCNFIYVFTNNAVHTKDGRYTSESIYIKPLPVVIQPNQSFYWIFFVSILSRRNFIFYSSRKILNKHPEAREIEKLL